MLISLNWIRDYVDLPYDLDPRALGERFTRTTAEVEGVEPITVSARGLIAACVVEVSALPDTRSVRLAVLDVGNGKTVETVTAAPVLPVDATVVYAPPGASVAALGDIGTTEVAGRASAGMILPGDAVGIAMAPSEAVFLSEEYAPGDALPPELFDDWVIEVDNKSLTHRPDLWGHYGIAREMAAIYRVPLKPFPVVDREELEPADLPAVEIDIADGHACRRYTGLMVEGVPTKPAPLWMQLRLGHVGMRPITALVDLTNYIMADLGQPMHAFDGKLVPRIEVDWAKGGETFRTLDGIDRDLDANTLMIKSGGESVALAGIMGGLTTEVSDTTQSLLLESANFDAATIRRAAGRLGLRTDASARFEKSLDPNNTLLSIQRFIYLARPQYPDLKLVSRLSDAYATPLQPVTVSVDPWHVTRMIGREIGIKEIEELLKPLGFEVAPDTERVNVHVPSFRASNDVTIEVDVIEELARFVGFETIVPDMPMITARRFEPNALHEIERETLRYLTAAHRFHEIHGYIWYDSSWLHTLGYDPGECVELENPAADGLHRLRQTLVPGLLSSVVKNRFHFASVSVVEVGSVFSPGETDTETKNVGMIIAQRGKKSQPEVVGRLKAAVEGWAWNRFGQPVSYGSVSESSDRPWAASGQTAAIMMGGREIGRTGVIDAPMKKRMDEHLAAWAIAWAEIALDPLIDTAAVTEALGSVPPYPLIDMDFSLLVSRSTPYADVATKLAAFDHPLIKLVRFVGSYEGSSIGSNERSLTFRVVIGDDTRTLVEADAGAFRGEFESHAKACGYQIRG